MNKKILSENQLKQIQELHDSGLYITELPKKVNISRKVLDRYFNEGILIKKFHKRSQSVETKKNMRNARIKYLKENPDKHPWKKNDKFKSKPCEILKQVLIENDIIFIPEYTDVEWGRFYSIDIAFPKNKIAIEINGNQHYNNDGSLKEYYQEKHNILEKNGWVIYEIHYSVIYNEKLLWSLVDGVKEFSLKQSDFDFYYQKFKNLKEERKKKYFCVNCGIEITKDSSTGRCTECSNIAKRKVIRPSISDLLLDIEKLGYCGTGRKYGVSDVAIRKWIKTKN